MKCQQEEQSVMDEQRAQIEKSPIYTLKENGRANVSFTFNIPSKEIGESIFVIFSNRVDSIIYRGQYKNKLFIDIDTSLYGGGGWDNLRFMLLLIDQNKICSWNNERGYPYWQPNAEVSVKFLESGIFDEENLFKQHEVIIHKKE